MDLFQISSLVTAVFSLAIGILVYLRNYEEKTNQAWFLTTMLISLWSVGLFGITSSTERGIALYWQYFLDVISIFIPIAFLIFTIYLLKIEKLLKIQKNIIIGFGFLLAIISFTKLFKKGVEPKFEFQFWIDPGPLYFIFPITFTLVVLYSIFLLLKYYKTTTDNSLKMQIRFIIGAQIFGFSGGITNFFPQLFNLYPFGNYFVAIYVAFISYAILKYQLFNIKVIATELLTFAVWVFLGARILLVNTWRERLIDGSLLILVIFFGILLIRSVSREVRHREELEKLTQKLEGLSKYKSELISIVAHQLKNPLAVVKGYSSLIGDGTIKEPNKIMEVYQKIKLSTNRLIDLLNNLLDLGHIEDGKMHYDFGPINLNVMLSEITSDFQFAASQKKLSLTLEPYSQDAVVNGDPYKLSQVFRNLVDNAIKYTEAGWVKVAISQEQIANGQTGIRVKFYDSGRGVSQELLPKLFQRFQRGVEEKQILGSGLGLYISKQIVEDHSGKIWAESDGEGKGSSFIVELPIATTLNK